MTISRQQILAAIAAETAERSGPMPAWLVAVAVNAKTTAARNAIDAELIALRSAGLIDCRGNRAQGSGITLTDAGRAELDRLRRAKPVAQTSDASVPTREVAATPPPREPVATPIPTPEPAADPELVEYKRQPALYALLCDLASLVGEHLHEAFEDDDLDEMARLRGLGRRIQHHTGGPRT
tara:strand:+ start:1713 stop:2255 length:543 start_codon:yes stop_codon:yes gene_type:complete